MEFSSNLTARRKTRTGLAWSVSAGLAAIIVLVSAPADAIAQNSTGAISSAAEQYQADVAWLADDALEGRGMESAGLEKSGKWVAKQFEVIGLEPAGDDGFFDPFTAQVMIPDPDQADNPHGGERREVKAFNVVGRIPADAANRLPGAIVVGAHYDLSLIHI